MKNNKIHDTMYQYHVKEMIFVNTWKKKTQKIAILSSFFIIIGLVLLIIFQLKTDAIGNRHAKYPTDLKYILFWNQPKPQHRGRFFVNKTPEFSSGQTMFIEQKCPNINCFITYDKNLLFNHQDYDAVVFDTYDVKYMNINQINFIRAREQVFIFRSLQSPENYPICDSGFDDFFNWTWTYKLNSNISQTFFNIYNENNTVVGPQKDMKWVEKMKHTTEFDSKVQKKSKAVAWIVAKCKLKAKHQDFIKELRNELKGYNYTVDIFGPCGDHKCKNIVKCQKLIEKSHFFQLLLEEYFSEDYVSDVIVTAMSYITIPIVLGAGDYRNFLPPSSYINANAFDMKKLGALINYLVRNVDMYKYFFDWKNHYYFKKRPKAQVCDLCKKLNDKNVTSRTYKHFRYWWDPEYKETCSRIRIYKIFNENL